MSETDDALRREMAETISANSHRLYSQIADALLSGPIAKHTAALQAERDADKSCIEADSIQISYLRATIVRLEVENTTLQAENARLTEERDAAIKVQEMAAMSGGFHARSAENAERQRDAAEARVSELEAENARLLKAMTGGL